LKELQRLVEPLRFVIVASDIDLAFD